MSHHGRSSSLMRITPHGLLVSASCSSTSLCSSTAGLVTETTLKLSIDKVIYGHEQAERFEVSVSSQAQGSIPAGTVWITQFATTLCTVTLSSGKGSCVLSGDQLAPGTYQPVATYGGNPDMETSTSAKEAFTVSKASSKTTLKLSIDKVTYGYEQAERLGVTVSPQYPGSTPTGTVTVKEFATTLCTVTLSSGKGSCVLSGDQLAPGIYQPVATYGGNPDMETSTSAKEAFTVSKASSKTTLKLSIDKVTYGYEQAERLGVTVSPQYPGSTPTGTVTVKEFATTLCTVTLSSGKGSCRPSPERLKASTYLLVASYGGSGSFRPSTSVKEMLTVTKAALPTTIPGTRVVLNFQGSGSEQTSQFTISSAATEWALGWAYNCSNSFTDSGSFSYFVYSFGQIDINDFGPSQFGTSGSSVEYYYDTGTFYLQVISECAWAVRATEIN